MTSDELIDGLERPARWWWSDHPKGQRKFVSTIPQQAADRIRELKAELDSLGDLSEWEKVCAGTHVIVPVEPTEAMICHGLIGLEGGQHSDGLFAKEMADAYRAMIRAAQPDKPQQGE